MSDALAQRLGNADTDKDGFSDVVEIAKGSNPADPSSFPGSNTWTLAVKKMGIGSGSVTSSPAGIDCGATCVKAFPQGASVTLTASVVAGSYGPYFMGWSGGGCSGTGLTCTVTLSGNSTVKAIFESYDLPIAATQESTAVLLSNGTIWAWGRNSVGQLGDGTTTDSPFPVQVGSDSDWVAIVGGDYHTVAVKRDGTLWQWGALADSNGTESLGSHPVQVGSDSNWLTVAAGGNRSIALKQDGSLWTWGWDVLQNGTADSSVPVRVGGDSDWVAITAGAWHALALKQDGTLWSWGDNSVGQLGNDTKVASWTPVKIGTDSDWISFAAGSAHSLALKRDGTLWQWGANVFATLGNGTRDTSLPAPVHPVPIRVGNDSDRWVSVAANGWTSLGIKADGTLWGWGWQLCGVLGQHDPELREGYGSLVPIQIWPGYDWVFVAYGGDHTVAIKSDGTLWSWGSNSHGQLGNGVFGYGIGPYPLFQVVAPGLR